jgi:mRNA interferase MazF
VSKRTYHPDRGDIALINFFPSAGREIDKRRPSIVLTAAEYNRRFGQCLVVPITSDLTPGGSWIRLPDGLLERPSQVLCDYVRSVDYRERAAAFVAKAPKAVVDEIVNRIMDLIDPVLT